MLSIYVNDCWKYSADGQSRSAKSYILIKAEKPSLYESFNPTDTYIVKMYCLVRATVQGNLCLYSTASHLYKLVGSSSAQEVVTMS